MTDLRVNIAGIEFKNPVMTASGTFGSGREYSDFVDLGSLGAVVVKGVSDVPWQGNPAPRIAETYGGMLNSVGLQNPGVDYFIEQDIPFLRKFDTKIIVNVCGHTQEEYIRTVKRLRDADVDMLELNVSCPNLKEGGLSFGTEAETLKILVSEVKKYAKQPVIVKLSPNVTDIVQIALAAEAAGADALSLINTITGMKIDIHKRKPVLANKVGGLSGPAVKPVAVRMVWQVASTVKIPIIGMGGIMNGEDAIEFIMAGANAVAVGSANFASPCATVDVIKGIKAYAKTYGLTNISEIRAIIK